LHEIGGYVTQGGEYRNVNRILVGNSEGNGRLEDRGLDILQYCNLCSVEKTGGCELGISKKNGQ
jgi:hypothetical protein